jgi:glucan phosphoethanolaminetransferase (alkaline phosphatase superfamily)
MEALYTAGLEIHFVGVVVLLAVVIFNIVMLALSQQVVRYSKRLRIVMPISSSLIIITIFTGIVMMAGKHLNFSFANIAMIILSIIFIGLEVKRYKILKHETDIKQENAFALYKQRAFRILGIEIAFLVVMSAWMLL